MDPEAVDALGSAGAAGGDDEEDGGVGLAETDDSGRVPHGGHGDPRVVDFSANVNPRPPEGAARVYEAAFAAARRYPADDYCEFRTTAAEYVGCDPRQVIPTAGGLSAIRLAVETTVGPGDSALVPYPSFGEFAREVRLQGADPSFVPADRLLEADPADHALAVLCNPNNPTGRAYDPAALRAFADRCRDAGTTLLVDEAFLGFTDRPSLAGREGVVVFRSLTKLFGFPGLRAGFAVATGDRREALEVARPAWSMGSVAAALGVHCMRDDAFVERVRERVERERTRMADRLSERFDVRPSDAPFLLFHAGSPSGVDEVLREAREADIAVRDTRSFRGLDAHVRVAVRLPEENDRLLHALGV